MTQAADVLVIGAGLHGCSAALQLARRGERVLLLERRHVARHSSGINAGGVRTLGRATQEIALSLAGMPYWHELPTLVGDDGGFVACGHIKVAESAAELAQLQARAELVRALGFSHEEVIEAAELRRLLPALSPHCVGGLIARGDGAADPWRTTSAFGAAARRAGVQVVEGEGVVALEPAGSGWVVVGERDRYRTRCVVNAAGAWGARIAALAGDAFPLRTRASMMIVTERMSPFVAPVVGATGRALSFKQTAAGTVLIGGGQQGRADLEAERSWVDPLGLARAAAAAVALFPCMAGVRMVRSWCGIEAETPDGIPVIDVSPQHASLVHVFGFSGHGFQLGPVCGVAAADLVQHGRSSLPIAPFSARRFIAAPATVEP